MAERLSRRIVIIGRNGQLARELAELAWPDDLHPHFLGRGEINLFDADDIRAQLESLRPVAIINTAAYTNVDKAETEPVLATQLNAEVPALLGQVTARLRIPHLHLSTDYVFAGSSDSPYREDDAVAPTSIYGQSKRAGEMALLAATTPTLILRSAGLFGRHGHNMLKTVLTLARGTQPIRMVTDQISTPTPAADLAVTLQEMAIDMIDGRALPRILHMAGQPAVSWYGFTAAILGVLHKSGQTQLPDLLPARLVDLGRPAPRPRYSALDCSLAASLGYAVPDWQATLPGLMAQLGQGRIAA
jgi:dTDP-4-dehydrorhamnose reductase